MTEKINTNFYKAFEDKFRGPPELIKTRLQVYLPYITPLINFYPDASAIDLGCGRGEWLEVLNTHGFLSQGIDLDDSMLSSCRQLKLNVQTAEAISFLKQLPDESQAIVSAFHLVEHIPFDDLQQLVSESLRVLKPGGLLIIETPNPENIKVATELFYLDPTHAKPIPSKLLSFLPEFYGYERTITLRLQENKNLATKDNVTLLDVIEGASPDYTVIAQKKAEAEILKKFDDTFALDIGLPLTTLATKFENRLQKIKTKASQAETIAHQSKAHAKQADIHAKQAEAKVVQLHTELHSVYISRSWKITAPLRWITNQSKLLLQLGLTGRAKALLKKTITPILRLSDNYLHSRPALRSKVVVFAKRLEIYTPLRKIYLRLTGRAQPVRNNHHDPKHITTEQLTASASEIYDRLKVTINAKIKDNN